MIVVGYDPVAGRVFAHRDGEPPSVDVPADGLTVKAYQAKGILYIELKGDVARLLYFDQHGLPGPVSLARAGEGWRVVAPG